MIIKLGGGDVGIAEGATVLDDGTIMVGVMFKNGAGTGNVGDDAPLLTVPDYDCHILSTSKESLIVLRNQVDRAINDFDNYVEEMKLEIKKLQEK